MVLSLVGLGIASARYYDWCQEASGPRDPVAFEVRDGQSGSEIVDGLHEQGVVRCGLVSRWLLRRSGVEGEFRTGTFELTTNMTPDAAFEVLTTPPGITKFQLLAARKSIIRVTSPAMRSRRASSTIS